MRHLVVANAFDMAPERIRPRGVDRDPSAVSMPPKNMFVTSSW